MYCASSDTAGQMPSLVDDQTDDWSMKPCMQIAVQSTLVYIGSVDDHDVHFRCAL